jgi:hypothetical protein
MRTARALPDRGYSTRLASLRIEVAPDDWPSETPSGALKLPTPSPRAIDAMDKTLRWLAFVPQDRFTLRRIVLLRATTSYAGRPMAWAKIARVIGADTAAIKPWHETAIALITRGLIARRIRIPCARDFP